MTSEPTEKLCYAPPRLWPHARHEWTDWDYGQPAPAIKRYLCTGAHLQPKEGK